MYVLGVGFRVLGLEPPRDSSTYCFHCRWKGDFRPLNFKAVNPKPLNLRAVRCSVAIARATTTTTAAALAPPKKTSSSQLPRKLGDLGSLGFRV